MTDEKIFNIPNALSFYRILVFPLILYFLLSGKETTYAVLLCINLFTDALDGFIARKFNMSTQFGARLDSLADIGTYILAFWGIFKFKSEDLINHGWILYIFLVLFVLIQILNLIRFRSFPSMHLYTFKTTGYIHAILFFTWFFVHFYPAYYYFAISFGLLAEIESIILIFLLKERRSNIKGLYWVLKARNE